MKIFSYFLSNVILFNVAIFTNLAFMCVLGFFIPGKLNFSAQEINLAGLISYVLVRFIMIEKKIDEAKNE